LTVHASSAAGPELEPWSRELAARSLRRAGFPIAVWAAFYPLLAGPLRVSWFVAAPLGALALTLGVAAFERRGRDTTVAVLLGTVGLLAAAMVLATVAAAVVGIPALFAP
jgi:hypothetical protein